MRVRDHLVMCFRESRLKGCVNTMDNLTSSQRHKNMKHIKSQDTKPEVLLRKALWNYGIRYRKNYKKLPGKPDIVLIKQKIAIFVDGDFWHGRDMGGIRRQVKTNKAYWLPKIERNIERGKEVNDALLNEGWLVLRFWESDIKKDLAGCVKTILSYLA